MPDRAFWQRHRERTGNFVMVYGAMSGIFLLTGQETFCDTEDLALFAPYQWYLSESYSSRYVYGRPLAGKGVVSMHRMLLPPPAGLIIDHINRNSLDNRRSNLRIATRRQNAWNHALHRNNTSGYKGVGFRPGKEARPWMAGITVNGKLVYLGAFVTREEAARAYNEAAIKYHGEFAHLNIIGEPGSLAEPR